MQPSKVRRKGDAFSQFHPIVNFVYFALVLLFSMCFMHPACLCISLVSGFAYRIMLKGSTSVRRSIGVLLFTMLPAALINPAFNHEGITILTYLPSGNPLTAESIYYGIAAAMMLAGVIIWFSCFNEVMSSDKFVWLFGRIIPALSLVLSMTLRFIPRFISQFRMVYNAQRCMGRDMGRGNLIQRIRCASTVLSITVTWSLENAIETADSMRARGYGLKGRSAFSVYRFGERDRDALLWLSFCGIYIICGWAAGGLYFSYYPELSGAPITPLTLSFFPVYLMLCLTPMFINAREDRIWKCS